MNSISIILSFLLAALVTCSTSSDITITELPPSEEFDAHYGTWNRDGTKILFHHTDLSGDVPKQYQLFVYDLNTKKRYKVLDGPSLNPDWSPDEQWITFHTNSIPLRLFKYSSSADSLVLLAGVESSIEVPNASIARWSPSGDKIMFTIIAGDPRGVMVMNSDGTNAKIIVPFAIGASWFPNGEHVVYANWDTQMPIGQQRQLYMSRADGSDPIRLTNLENSDFVGSPSVSPDGNEIVFVHQPYPGTLDLYLLDLETKAVRRLTYTPKEVAVYRPQWHPDGNRILFTTTVSSTIINQPNRLYTINPTTGKIEAVFSKL